MEKNKHMRGNRIYRVLIILLLASTAHAGWNTNIWNLANEYANDPWKPAITNNADITNGTALAVNIIETNLYAICVTDVITRISTTNYIPAITRIITATIPFLSSVGALEFNSHATNIYCCTNTYYTNVSYGGTSVMSVSGSTNYTCAMIFMYGGFTNFTTTTVSRVNVGGIYSFRLDADDQRTYELFGAINEREAAIRGTNAVFVTGRMFRDPYVPEPYYGGLTDNLAEAKRWIYVNLTNFLNVSFAQSTANTSYDFTEYLCGTNITYTYIPKPVDDPIGWMTNISPRTSIPRWTAKDLLLYVKAPLNWFGSLSVSVSTNLYRGERTYNYKPLIIDVSSTDSYYVVIETNITPSYAANSYRQYGRDLTGIGFPFSYAVTSSLNIIRYPASKWISGGVTNFKYTYEPNEIITNVMHLWDGTVTNVTGTNGQRVTWTNYPATQPYIGFPESVVSIAGSSSVSVTNIDAYGLKFITNILSQLVVCPGTLAWETNQTKYSSPSIITASSAAVESNIGPEYDNYLEFSSTKIHFHSLYSGLEIATSIIARTYGPQMHREILKESPHSDVIYSFAWDIFPEIIVPKNIYLGLYGKTNSFVHEKYVYFRYPVQKQDGSPFYRTSDSWPVYSEGISTQVFYGYKCLAEYLYPASQGNPVLSYSFNALVYTSIVVSVDVVDSSIGYSATPAYETNSIQEFVVEPEWNASSSAAYWMGSAWVEEPNDSSGCAGGSAVMDASGYAHGSIGIVSSGTVSSACGNHSCNSTNGFCVGWVSEGMFLPKAEQDEFPPYSASYTIDWDFVSVRNYAVTNGFKYY
jgi:hypothetical protein